MSELSVVCKQCLTEFEPRRDDIMRGYSWWSLCPTCRNAAVTKRDKARPPDGGNDA